MSAVPQELERFDEALDEERSDDGVLQTLIAVMQPATLGEYVRYADHRATLASQAARMENLEKEIEHLHSCIEKADRWPPGYEGRN